MIRNAIEFSLKAILRHSRSQFCSSSQDQKRGQQIFRSKKKQESEKKQEKPQTQRGQEQRRQPDRKHLEDEEEDQEFNFQEENRWSRGWIIWRTAFWGSSALLTYHLYLVAYHKGPEPLSSVPTAVPGFLGLAQRLYDGYNSSMEFFFKPPAKKLLPDPFHIQFHPKTLVLNLSGTLVDPGFVIGKGITIKKRPGLRALLTRLSKFQKYEIIIFSDDDYQFLGNSALLLDPKHSIFSGSFGRQCMIYHSGKYIKDLQYLNRDLSKVIVIDKMSNPSTKQQENVILLPDYHGEEEDDELLKLLPFLQRLASPEVKDVRKVLAQLGPKPHHVFYENQKKKQEKLKEIKKSSIWNFFSSPAKKSDKKQQ